MPRWRQVIRRCALIQQETPPRDWQEFADLAGGELRPVHRSRVIEFYGRNLTVQADAHGWHVVVERKHQFLNWWSNRFRVARLRAPFVTLDGFAFVVERVADAAGDIRLKKRFRFQRNDDPPTDGLNLDFRTGWLARRRLSTRASRLKGLFEEPNLLSLPISTGAGQFRLKATNRSRAPKAGALLEPAPAMLELVTETGERPTASALASLFDFMIATLDGLEHLHSARRPDWSDSTGGVT